MMTSTPAGSRRQFDLALSPEQARPVVHLVNLIILEALRAGAEQAHLHARTLLVRYCRGGEWSDVMKVPGPALRQVINRLRVMAELDRTRGNARQEGTATVVAEGTPITIRILAQFTEDDDEEVYVHLPSPEHGSGA